MKTQFIFLCILLCCITGVIDAQTKLLSPKIAGINTVVGKFYKQAATVPKAKSASFYINVQGGITHLPTAPLWTSSLLPQALHNTFYTNEIFFFDLLNHFEGEVLLGNLSTPTEAPLQHHTATNGQVWGVTGGIVWKKHWQLGLQFMQSHHTLSAQFPAVVFPFGTQPPATINGKVWAALKRQECYIHAGWQGSGRVVQPLVGIVCGLQRVAVSGIKGQLDSVPIPLHETTVQNSLVPAAGILAGVQFALTKNWGVGASGQYTQYITPNKQLPPMAVQAGLGIQYRFRAR